VRKGEEIAPEMKREGKKATWPCMEEKCTGPAEKRGKRTGLICGGNRGIGRNLGRVNKGGKEGGGTVLGGRTPPKPKTASCI